MTTIVYAVRTDDETNRFVALFVNEDEADEYASEYGFTVDEHYMPADATAPWLM